MNKIILLALILSLATTWGCGRRYAKGAYIPADEVILRSDKFVEADLQLIAHKLSQSLLLEDNLVSGQPKILMSLITNSTDEHIDMKSLSDKIRTELFRSKKMQFVNETLRPTLNEELNYEESSGYVDPQTAKRRGKQTGADYLISGNISAIKQPVGRQEIVYYKMTLEMTSLSTNVISWTDEVEIKKQFRKRFTGS